MPHSFNKIWIHAIWATKERMPLIHDSVEQKLYQFIAGQLCPNHSPRFKPWAMGFNAEPKPFNGLKLYC